MATAVITFDRNVLVQLSRDARFDMLLPQLQSLKTAAASGKGCGCKRRVGVTDSQVEAAKNSIANLFGSDPGVVQQVKALLDAAQLRIKLFRQDRNVHVIKKF